jgi:hypothetical protein
LTFEDYVQLGNHQWLTYHNPHLTGRPQVGWYGSALVNWYGRDPDRFLLAATSRPPTCGEFRNQIAGVHLLRTGQLNHQLCDYLNSCGVSEDRLQTIRNAPKLRPPDPETKHRHTADWRAYYTPELLNLVRRRERLAMEAFPEFDV